MVHEDWRTFHITCVHLQWIHIIFHIVLLTCACFFYYSFQEDARTGPSLLYTKYRLFKSKSFSYLHLLVSFNSHALQLECRNLWKIEFPLLKECKYDDICFHSIFCFGIFGRRLKVSLDSCLQSHSLRTDMGSIAFTAYGAQIWKIHNWNSTGEWWICTVNRKSIVSKNARNLVLVPWNYSSCRIQTKLLVTNWNCLVRSYRVYIW